MLSIFKSGFGLGLDCLTLPDWESPILKWFYVHFSDTTPSGFNVYITLQKENFTHRYSQGYHTIFMSYP